MVLLKKKKRYERELFEVGFALRLTAEPETLT